MKLENFVDFYEENELKELEQVKKYFFDVLEKEFVVKLRVLDPRIKHFECYGELAEEDWKKISEIYANAKKDTEGNNELVTISVVGKVGFTIYNVNSLDKETMIAEHDRQYENKLKECDKVVF